MQANHLAHLPGVERGHDHFGRARLQVSFAGVPKPSDRRIGPEPGPSAAKCICGDEMCLAGTYPRRCFGPHVYISRWGGRGRGCCGASPRAHRRHALKPAYFQSTPGERCQFTPIAFHHALSGAILPANDSHFKARRADQPTFAAAAKRGNSMYVMASNPWIYSVHTVASTPTTSSSGTPST